MFALKGKRKVLGVNTAHEGLRRARGERLPSELWSPFSVSFVETFVPSVLTPRLAEFPEQLSRALNRICHSLCIPNSGMLLSEHVCFTHSVAAPLQNLADLVMPGCVYGRLCRRVCALSSQRHIGGHTLLALSGSAFHCSSGGGGKSGFSAHSLR